MAVTIIVSTSATSQTFWRYDDRLHALATRSAGLDVQLRVSVRSTLRAGAVRCDLDAGYREARVEAARLVPVDAAQLQLDLRRQRTVSTNGAFASVIAGQLPPASDAWLVADTVRWRRCAVTFHYYRYGWHPVTVPLSARAFAAPAGCAALAVDAAVRQLCAESAQTPVDAGRDYGPAAQTAYRRHAQAVFQHALAAVQAEQRVLRAAAQFDQNILAKQ